MRSKNAILARAAGCRCGEAAAAAATKIDQSQSIRSIKVDAKGKYMAWRITTTTTTPNATMRWELKGAAYPGVGRKNETGGQG
jgi:hypothetical protein